MIKEARNQDVIDVIDVITVADVTGVTCSPRKCHASDRLASLARAVARLAPSHRDPEQFHLEKSEVVAELRRLARELGQ